MALIPMEGIATSSANMELASLKFDDQQDLLFAVIELEKRFQALTDGLDVGVIIHGPQTEILFGNPRAQELLGATIDQLRGKTSFDPRWKAVREDGTDFPAPERPTALAFRTKMPQRGVIVGIHRPETDDRVWLLVSAIPQFNPDGTIRQVVATFTDISIRMAAEQQIREQKAQILELSVPFIPLVEGVALMPIIGELDYEHALRMLDVALTQSAHHGCRIIVLDLTGAPTITPEGAAAFRRISNACRLVGSRVIITGLRGNAARTLVQYAPDLQNIPVFSRLQTALSQILSGQISR
jgi:rsbT co-antagonist protein RsbR